MTIELLALEWAQKHPQYSKLNNQDKKRAIKEIMDCIKFTLTSMMDELPEVNELTCKDHAIGQGYYKSKIINQIQTKLK